MICQVPYVYRPAAGALCNLSFQPWVQCQKMAVIVVSPLPDKGYYKSGGIFQGKQLFDSPLASVRQKLMLAFTTDKLTFSEIIIFWLISKFISLEHNRPATFDLPTPITRRWQLYITLHYKIEILLPSNITYKTRFCMHLKVVTDEHPKLKRYHICKSSGQSWREENTLLFTFHV